MVVSGTVTSLYESYIRMTSKTATNQNGHMITVIGEHVNKYLSLNKLGIIKSRTETMPEVQLQTKCLTVIHL